MLFNCSFSLMDLEENWYTSLALTYRMNLVDGKLMYQFSRCTEFWNPRGFLLRRCQETARTEVLRHYAACQTLPQSEAWMPSIPPLPADVAEQDCGELTRSATLVLWSHIKCATSQSTILHPFTYILKVTVRITWLWTMCSFV